MTEREDEQSVSRRYRELAAEEPPTHLDEAIRARARGAVEPDAVPAPLAPSTGRRTWYFPAAAAALLVLAVAVTLQIERQQPDAYVAQTREEAPPERRSSANAPLQGERKAAPLAKQTAPAAETPAAPAAPPAMPEAERKEEALARSGVAARAMRDETAKVDSPEHWLERIARLRAAGRHDEADAALLVFRKRYPDFRIAPEMLERVEKK